jgi:hypothetical protein
MNVVVVQLCNLLVVHCLLVQFVHLGGFTTSPDE